MRQPFSLAALMVLLLSGPALGQVRFTEGPEFTPSGKLLIISGSLGGLEDQVATIQVDAEGSADVVCRDEDGKIVGRSRKIPVKAHIEQKIDQDMIAGGHAAIFLMSSPPVLDRRNGLCGNPRLRSTIEEVTFRTARIVVRQGGTVVLRQEFKL